MAQRSPGEAADHRGRHPAPALGTRSGDPAQAEPLLDEILLLLRTNTGHDFQHYKRATVLRRIERRLHVTGQPNLAAYQRYLEQHPAESAELLADMLIGVTNFSATAKRLNP